MHSKSAAALLVALSSCLFASTAAASAFEDISLGAGVSTLGGGLDLNAQLSNRFSATLGYSAMSIGADERQDDIRYKGDLKLNNATVKLNWHPMAGGFHVSAGAVVGDVGAAVTGTPLVDGVYEINGVSYTAADAGELRGQVDLKKSVAPYAGLGYRSRGDGLGFFGEVGVISARADVHLSATGQVANDPQFQADLAAQERDLQDDVDMSIYPIVGVGMVYRF